MQKSRISRRQLKAAGATAHPDAELLAMEAELDAACRRARNSTLENDEKLAIEMLNIGHRIIDTRAHTPEGMRLKIRAMAKMETRDSGDAELVLESIARDLGVADLDAAA